MKQNSNYLKINVVYMPIYFTIRNLLSQSWIYEKNSLNYFQTENNHQKNFQLNRRKKGGPAHSGILNKKAVLDNDTLFITNQ